MKNLTPALFIVLIILAIAAMTGCNNGKPKPASNNITQTTVTVSGKKDSVINNPEKNYGNATISEPCIKCLIGIVQQTDSYLNLTSSIPPQNIIYDANWITSTKPFNLADGNKIINGMMVAVKLKDGGPPKTLTTYLYDNENGRFYLQQNQNNSVSVLKIDTLALKKIRASCFWGVASAK